MILDSYWPGSLQAAYDKLDEQESFVEEEFQRKTISLLKFHGNVTPKSGFEEGNKRRKNHPKNVKVTSASFGDSFRIWALTSAIEVASSPMQMDPHPSQADWGFPWTTKQPWHDLQLRVLPQEMSAPETSTWKVPQPTCSPWQRLCALPHCYM